MRKIGVAYPCRPQFCETCQGFGHLNCGRQTWSLIASRPLVVPAARTSIPIITFPTSTTTKTTMVTSSLNSNSTNEDWQTVPWRKSCRPMIEKSGKDKHQRKEPVTSTESTNWASARKEMNTKKQNLDKEGFCCGNHTTKDAIVEDKEADMRKRKGQRTFIF